jgi:hypothetical protein
MVVMEGDKEKSFSTIFPLVRSKLLQLRVILNTALTFDTQRLLVADRFAFCIYGTARVITA